MDERSDLCRRKIRQKLHKDFSTSREIKWDLVELLNFFEKEQLRQPFPKYVSNHLISNGWKNFSEQELGCVLDAVRYDICDDLRAYCAAAIPAYLRFTASLMLSHASVNSCAKFASCLEDAISQRTTPTIVALKQHISYNAPALHAELKKQQLMHKRSRIASYASIAAGIGAFGAGQYFLGTVCMGFGLVPFLRAHSAKKTLHRWEQAIVVLDSPEQLWHAGLSYWNEDTNRLAKEYNNVLRLRSGMYM
jgi:hypothetical protein